MSVRQNRLRARVIMENAVYPLGRTWGNPCAGAATESVRQPEPFGSTIPVDGGAVRQWVGRQPN